MKIIPRRLAGMARKGGAGIVARFDHIAGVGFQNEPLRRETHLPVGRGETAKRCALDVDIGLIARVGQDSGLALQVPKRAPDGQAR